ncbi:RRNAD1 family protein [Megaselia abdita]
MKKKFLPDRKVSSSPKHINLKLTKELTTEDFLTKIECEKEDFGVIGLHPCGDLSSILIRHFVQCKNAKFLNILGCCFMKLSQEGFPMSRFLKGFNNDFHKLSYESREIACHAIEMYKTRLEQKDYDYLKVHSFRAAVEEIIVKHWPHLKHSGLKSVKHSQNMTFEE